MLGLKVKTMLVKQNCDINRHKHRGHHKHYSACVSLEKGKKRNGQVLRIQSFY